MEVRPLVDLHSLMSLLSNERPLFHSEADFQHALAWLLHAHYPDAWVRLEFPLYLGDNEGHIDLFASVNNRRYAIELKYKTSTFTGKVKGEEFQLKNQAAQDLGRYDVLKDLQRMEEVAANGASIFGWVIFLTNDSSYWNPTLKTEAADADFRIHEGAKLTGTLDWGANASKGTTRNRETPITLKGRYPCKWRDYSEVGEGKISRFRYLLIRAT